MLRLFKLYLLSVADSSTTTRWCKPEWHTSINNTQTLHDDNDVDFRFYCKNRN